MKKDIKRKLKIICSCIATICLLIVSLQYLTDLMELKDSDFKYLPFLEQNEDFDVLFMGTSHVLNGIYPMELWNDYGIVSYNMGGHANQLATTYWVLENALEQTSPKLVVIDCFELDVNVKSSSLFSYGHFSFDAFPLNDTKLSAVRDLLDDPQMKQIQGEEEKERTGMELLWNYPVYHMRWSELTERDFAVPSTKEKGAEFRLGVAMPDEMVKIPAESKLEGETVGTEYLRKMIEDCQNRDIEVLLMFVPYPAGERSQMSANRVYDIADEYGVNYINFLDMNLVDYNTDCYDDSHLNPSGARKVTEYLGEYIMEHYDISDQRTNEVYSDWHEDYKEYSEYKVDVLKEQESLDLYLMFLADKNLDVVLEINNPKIWEDEYYVRLLQNIGSDETNYKSMDETGDKNESDIHITVKDRITQDIIDQADFSL